jgi:hypothetical protein
MIILGRNVFSSFDDLKLIQDNEIQSIINMITDEHMMGDYKPRLIIFAFMKQIIYDFYNYVQVIQDDLNSSMKNFSSFSAEKSS